MLNTVLGLCCCLALVGTGCARQEGSAPSDRGRQRSVDAGISGDQLNRTSLVRAVEAVVASCEVAGRGFVHSGSCRRPGVQQRLKRQERALGRRAALRAYCQMLADPRRRVGAFASFRIRQMSNHRRMRRAADKLTFNCLRARLSSEQREDRLMAVVRATALMGMALNEQQATFEVIEQHPSPQVRAVGYQALWANGRLKVFSRLERVIRQGSDLEPRLAAIRGFGDGGELTAQEAQKVCGLLFSLLRHEQVLLAAVAAHRSVTLCDGATERVLKTARRALRRGTFDPELVRALSAAAGFFEHKAPPEQLRRIVDLLAQVVGAKRVAPTARAVAMRTVHRLDRERGRALARRHQKDAAELIRRAARRVLRRPRGG